MPLLRHSISQIFAPHPAFALRNSQSYEQSIHPAPAVPTNNDEMISSLQPKRPTIPIPATTSTPPTNSPANSIPTHALLFDQSSVPPLSFSIPPRTQIEALPPHTTSTTNVHPISYPARSPFTYLTHKNGTFVLDSATRHPVFFTDKLRKAPTGVMACEYGNDVWRSGSPVARGYVYESGRVEEREAKL